MKVVIGKPRTGNKFTWFIHRKFGINLMKQRVKIKMHPWDTWSADCTLSPIITAVLKQYYGNFRNYGIPMDETVESWDDKLSKMIHAFEDSSRECHDPTFDDIFFEEDGITLKPNYIELSKEVYSKRKEGLLLFAEHYRSLWE